MARPKLARKSFEARDFQEHDIRIENCEKNVETHYFPNKIGNNIANRVLILAVLVTADFVVRGAYTRNCVFRQIVCIYRREYYYYIKRQQMRLTGVCTSRPETRIR